MAFELSISTMAFKLSVSTSVYRTFSYKLFHTTFIKSRGMHILLLCIRMFSPEGLSCAGNLKFLSFLWYHSGLFRSCSEVRKILMRLYNLTHLYEALTGSGSVGHKTILQVSQCTEEKHVFKNAFFLFREISFSSFALRNNLINPRVRC